MYDTYQFAPWIAQVGLGLLLLCALATLIGARLARARRSAPPADSPGAPLLVVRGVGKSYRDRRVLDAVGLEVRPGEVLGVLGPNGAGKTTLMRLATRLVYADEGSVRTVASGPTSVGAAIARPGVLPHLSGRENLRLAWAATGLPIRDAHLADATAAGGLTEAELDRRAGDYSQGTAQRLALALAMLGTPRLLILDEPTNGLDPLQIEHQREVLTSYAHGGRGVVISTHLLDEAARVCTRVVVLHEGRLVGELGPGRLQAPHETVVADLTQFYRQAIGEGP